MAFKMKGFEPHNMYKTKKANTHKDHLALEKKGYDHNPYKKASSFTKTNGDDKKKIAENQDPGSGRSKKEEMAHDMRMTKKEIARFEKEGNNKAIGMLKSALERQKKAYIELYGKLPGMGLFE